MTTFSDLGTEEGRRQRDIAVAMWLQSRLTASTDLSQVQRQELTTRLLDKLGYLGEVAATF